MEVSFDDKTVVVTGGTKGIGKAIAEGFAKAGARVIVTGRAVSRDLEVESNIEYVTLDLRLDSSIESFLEYLTSLKQIDAFVNCAGINIISESHEIINSDFDDVIKVNLRGPLIICRHLATLMRGKGGRILNIGSIWSEITKKGRVSYIASKSGLAGMTRGLATDLAGCNILVNTLSPGFVDTELTRRSLSVTEILDLEERIPLGRIAQTEEISRFAIFLCSDLNSYMTGQNLIVDGGFSNV